MVLGAVLPAAWEMWRWAQARGERRKTLSYNVLLNSKLSLDPPDIGDIVRLYDRDGNEILDPSLAVVRITNEGVDNIDATDYQMAITLQFPPDMKIRTVEVTDVHPRRLCTYWYPSRERTLITTGESSSTARRSCCRR
jgi:hypothetical protein